MTPPFRRRRHDPYGKHVLGIRVRQAENAAVAPLKLTDYRATLLRAADKGEIKRGRANSQFENAWRWKGSTVTVRVQELIGVRWLTRVGEHAELTDAGRAALERGEG